MPNVNLRFCILAFVVCLTAQADVALPVLLADHMVVQRGLPVHVWGKAAEGESVSVTFRGSTRSTTADSIGQWSVYLPPVEAGGPYELIIQGNTASRSKTSWWAMCGSLQDSPIWNSP